MDSSVAKREENPPIGNASDASFYEVTGYSLVLKGLNNNKIYMINTNPSSNVISANSTRFCLNEARIGIENFSSYPLESIPDIPENAFVFGNGAKRYDFEPAQKFKIDDAVKISPILTSSDNESERYGTSLLNEVQFSSDPVLSYQNTDIGNVTRQFYIQDKSSNWISSQGTLRAVGTNCYVWVIDSYFDTSSNNSINNKVNSEQISALANKFDSIYGPETNIFGEKYNEAIKTKAGYSNLIDPKDKISILVYDIKEDFTSEQTGGVFGFFWGKDFLSSDYTGVKTNKDEIFYVDAHFLDKYPKTVYSTLAHEFQHMLHFVHKELKNNKSSSTWFNEMLSMVCEDMLQGVIGIEDFESLKSRFSTFNNSYHLSGVTDWLSEGDVFKSYASAYVFGAYLARNYGGATLIKNIASNTKVDKEAITDALQASNYQADTFDSVFIKYPQIIVNTVENETNALSFNKKVEKTINNTKYTFNAVNLMNYGAETIKGPSIFKSAASDRKDLRPYGFSVHIIGVGSGDITLKFASDVVAKDKLYIMVK